MADIQDLVSRVRKSRLGQAVSNIASSLDRDKEREGFQLLSPQGQANLRAFTRGLSGQQRTTPPDNSFSRGVQRFGQFVERVEQSPFGAPSRFTTGLGQNIARSAQASADFGRQAAERAQERRESGQSRLSSAFSPDVLKPTGLGLFQGAKTLAQTTPIGGAQAMPTGLAGAGIQGSFGALQGRDFFQEAGRGFGEGLGLRTVTRFTDPVISRAIGGIGGGFAQRQIGQRLVSGLGNVVEDEILSGLEGINNTNRDRIASLALGAVIAGNNDLIKRLKTDLTQTGIKPNQADEIVRKTQQLRDSRGRFSRIGEEYGETRQFSPISGGGFMEDLQTRVPASQDLIEGGQGLIRRARSRLQEAVDSGTIRRIQATVDGQKIDESLPLDQAKQLEDQLKNIGVEYRTTDIVGQGGFARLGTEPQKIKTQQVIKSQDPEIAVQKANSSTPQKKRKFIQTVIKSKEATPKMKEAVAKIDPQKYTVQPNVQSIAFADEYINKNGLDSAKEFVTNSKKPDQNTIATGLELMRQYQAQGNYDQALEVLEALDNQGREAGRLIQSLSMWSRLSPEGMLRFAQKEFNKANKRLTKLGRVELDEELARDITTRMNAIGRMDDGPEKTRATKEVLNLISEKIPWSVSELLDAYRYQNMLSGPNTQFRNIYGNAFQGAILRPSTIPFEVVNDYIGATLRGQERTRYFNEVPVYLRKFWGSMPEATEAFLQSMKGQDIDVKRLDLDQQRRQNLPQVLTVVPRFMEGMDRFFSTMIRNAETARLMSNGVNEKQALEEANKIAENLLFRSQLDPSNKTGQGQLLLGIDKAVSWIQKSPVPGMRWFVPFVSTPTNVLKQLIEYSPGVGLANLPGNDKKGQLLAKQALASVIALGGAQLAMSGRATWAAPTDPKEKELFYATGRKPYSVRIGDTWVPLSYLGPLAGAVALPAAINYWQNESKTSLTDSQLKKLGKIAGAQMEFISQQSFLSNVGTMIDVMRGDIDSSIEGTLGFTAGQLIPLSGLVRYINKAVDPVYRKARGFTESIAKDLPGLSKELEAYTTPDGQISTRETRNLFLPFDVGTARDEYELPLRERQEYNKQKNALNFAKKQLEAGRLPTGETLKTGSGLTTSQTRDFIREKIKLGFDVPPEELETAYLKTALDMPSSNRYERGQKESKLFSTLGDIENNENLSTSQKDILKNRIAEEVGLTREDLDVYQVAKQTNNEKTLYLLDQRDAQSNDEFLRTLIRGRKPINGKVLTSDGVLDNLVQDGIIPEQLAKDLKKIDLDEKGQLKTRKTSSGGRKIKTAQFNYSALSSLKPFGSSARVSVPKINVSNLTFGG